MENLVYISWIISTGFYEIYELWKSVLNLNFSYMQLIWPLYLFIEQWYMDC